MVQAITATYVHDDEDWTVTVASNGQQLTGTAPGIIAARDRADQLVEKLTDEDAETTVVHLLEGSALQFTTVYMTARLARTVDDDGTDADAATDTAENSADSAPEADEASAENDTPEVAAAADDTPKVDAEGSDAAAEEASDEGQAAPDTPDQDGTDTPEATPGTHQVPEQASGEQQSSKAAVTTAAPGSAGAN